MICAAAVMWRRSPRFRSGGLPLLLAALLASSCATPQPSAFRHPDFRPASIRRPVVVLQVSLEQTSLLGEGEFSRRERSSLPEAVEIALLEGLNAEGILPVDVTLSARGFSRDGAVSFERIDRRRALERARTLNADVVLIVGISLSRRDLVYCRAGTRASGAGGRPFVAPTTLWTLGAEVLRVADGARLLVEPPGLARQLTDIEPECDRGRIGRRLSAHEMLQRAVQELLALLLRK